MWYVWAEVHFAMSYARSMIFMVVMACRATGADDGAGDLPREACAQSTPLRRVLWGDLHVHSAWSMDTLSQHGRVTPIEAYGFGKGDPVMLPPLNPDGTGTREVRIDRPLDFLAVTDHSEFLGETRICRSPDLEGYDSAACQASRGVGLSAVGIGGVELTLDDPKRDPDICGADGHRCADAAAQAWTELQGAAEDAYDRTSACSFTSFVGYEYTGIPGASVMHRNVIFRGNVAPAPITYFDVQRPLDLWEALDRECIRAGDGCDVLAIPHNPNESNGHAFMPLVDVEIGEAQRQASLRARMEPVMEIFQHKGDSECMNGLSGFLGAPDEACDFEKVRRDPTEDCGNAPGTGGQLGLGCFSSRDFARGALLTGLEDEQRLGVNPIRMGFIASTDTHNGTPGNVREADWPGHLGTEDADPAVRLRDVAVPDGGVEYNPGGLAAVWAEENSRASIFDAIRRRETYATSGPRITVRLFGGWDLPDGMCDDPDAVQVGYDRGVPMGGVLPAPPVAGTPRFFVTATADPGMDAHPGAPLQRIQIIKGWTDEAGGHTQVFDVAGQADNGATVDLQTCASTGPGLASLCTTWTDPEFDPNVPAFYYARVLENPTCRWSVSACLALPVEAWPPACLDPSWTKAIQERAWTSPIWFVPT